MVPCRSLQKTAACQWGMMHMPRVGKFVYHVSKTGKSPKYVALQQTKAMLLDLQHDAQQVQLKRFVPPMLLLPNSWLHQLGTGLGYKAVVICMLST